MLQAGGGGDEPARGHGESEPWLSLQQQSMELGRVALMGSGAHKEKPAACPLVLLKKLEQLKHQKSELQKRIRAEEMSIEDFHPENISKENLTEIIAHYEKEIEKLKVAHYNKSLLLRRMQLYDAIHNKLLENKTESKLMYESMEHSMGLCNYILKSQKETLALEDKLIEVRKKRMELKQTCTQVMTELRALKENERNFDQMDNQKFSKIHSYVAKEIDIVTVIQNIFQRLILGSCIDWAEDPKLKETVLKLGKNPACF
ncbi:centromere protein H [Bufo gargarizans]|uniref:centromere protein H n=1 Tax=Bufo gargarizans TaxID=30331 RepID=UPI001CF41184|nr:centromere protein H [Bufo gargarizans]